MTHSPDSAFGSPSGKDAQPWSWRHETADGTEILQERREEFPSRGDAETWLGLHFEDLADTGVEAVSLFEGERLVFGPMSLEA